MVYNSIKIVTYDVMLTWSRWVEFFMGCMTTPKRLSFIWALIQYSSLYAFAYTFCTKLDVHLMNINVHWMYINVHWMYIDVHLMYINVHWMYINVHWMYIDVKTEKRDFRPSRIPRSLEIWTQIFFTSSYPCQVVLKNFLSL